MSISSQPASVNSTSILSTSYGARYGEAAEHGCTPLPDVLIRYHRHLGMTYGEWDVTTQILTYKWTAAHPYPTIEALAHALDVKTRQVQELLASLQHKGLVHVIERPGRSNAYDLTPMIEKAHELAHLDMRGVQKTCTPLDLPTHTGRAAALPLCAADGMQENHIPRGAENLHPKQNYRKQKNDIDVSVPPTPVAQVMEPPTNEKATAWPQARFDTDYQALVEPLAAIGEELGDQAHPLASVTRAYKLMTAARLDVAAFLALVEEARLHTLAAIQARRRNKPPKVDNPMAYYFGVLARLTQPDKHPPQWRTGPPRKRPAAALPPSSPPSNTWEAVTAEAVQIMTPENVARWFTPARQLAHVGDVLTVAVPDAFHCQWLDGRLRRSVDRCASSVQPGLQVRFIVEPLTPPLDQAL